MLPMSACDICEVVTYASNAFFYRANRNVLKSICEVIRLKKHVLQPIMAIAPISSALNMSSAFLRVLHAWLDFIMLANAMNPGQTAPI